MTNYRFWIQAGCILLLFCAPSCRKAAEQPKPDEHQAVDAQAPEAPAANTETKPAANTEIAQNAANDHANVSECPSNPADPDGLYRDFFDCDTPFPMKDGKAAKYDKSWKEGDDGAGMNGYEFSEITQEFIDEYKKRLEAAGYMNDRPVEAPPIYQKKLSDTSEFRVHLTDTLCKEWMDDCDDTIKTGKLMVETALMTFDPPEEPAPEKPAPDAEKIKAAYNNPADPDKLYAGLPQPCIFPMKAGKALPYGSKTDLLDDPNARDPGKLTYTFYSTENFDILDFIDNEFTNQLKAAGFTDGDRGDGLTKKTDAGFCSVGWDAGEGELNLRFYIQE